MSEYLRCLLAHGDAARVAAGRAPSGPNRLRGAETLLSALLCAGLTEREAVDAHLVLTTYVVGFALELQAAIASAPAVAVDDEFKAEYPTFASLAELASAGAAEHFRQGQTLVLDGIEARIVTASRRHGCGRRYSSRVVQHDGAASVPICPMRSAAGRSTPMA